MMMNLETPYNVLSREVSRNGLTHASRIYWHHIKGFLWLAHTGQMNRTQTARTVRAYRNAWDTLTD